MSDQKSIKLSVSGASGRMGQRVIALAHERGVFELIEAICSEDAPEIGMDPLALAVPAASSDAAFSAGPIDASPEVMVDFSLPPAFLPALRSCVARGCAFVSGTTGLSDEHWSALEEAAKTIPVLHAPNFSVGVNLLCRLVDQAARVMGDADIEIVEMHHNQKKDSPSGTADRLLEVVCDALERDKVKDTRHGRHGDVGARTKREIGMHALRGGDVVGDHTVMFAALGERIELTHKASSRDTFAAGAVRAAEWLAGKPAGRYTIDQVLFGE